MATTNYNLPTITGNMTADVVRDMNALAEATDGAIKSAVEGVDLTPVTQEITQVKNDFSAHLAESKKWAKSTITGQSIPNKTVTSLFFSTTTPYNGATFLSISSGKLRITEPGIYLIAGNLIFNSASTGQAAFYLGDVITYTNIVVDSTSTFTGLSNTNIVEVKSPTTLSIDCYQSSGAPLTIYTCSIKIIKLVSLS